MNQLEINFFNTINASEQELAIYDSQATSLEKRIESLFRYHSTPMAWFQVKQLLPANTNEVSIKRAITNLKTKKVLQKTEEMILGPYGKPSHKYFLNNCFL